MADGVTKKKSSGKRGFVDKVLDLVIPVGAIVAGFTFLGVIEPGPAMPDTFRQPTRKTGQPAAPKPGK